MVTRVSTTQDMSSQVLDQMFLAPKALYIAAGILTVMGVVPGMPHFAFLSLAALVGGIGWYRDKKLNEPSVEPYEGPMPGRGGAGAQIQPGGGPAELPPGEGQSESSGQPQRELGWDDVMTVDIIGLEVGYRLIPLVDKSQGGQLLGRIKGVRKKLSQELGFLMPSVHIRDSMVLMPNAYRITLMGVSLAEAEIHPERELAINPGQVFGEIEGIAGIDPAFGMEATWIEPDKKDQAQALGYTVVDASTVVATHMNQLLQKHAYELIGHEEVQQWLDQLSKQAPKLAEELVPNTVSVSNLLKVLQNLLQEDVPIKDMRSIAEALISRAPKGAEPDALTEACRQGLKRLIVQTLIDNAPEIPVITLEPELEQLLLKSVQQAQKSGAPDELGMVLEPGIVENLQRSMSEAAQRQEMLGNPVILLVSAPIRSAMAKFSRFVNDSVRVLSYQEIPDNKQINIVATVGQ